MNNAEDIEQLRRTVAVHKQPGSPFYVRLVDIPQPWLDRFLVGLVGSQMPVIEGEVDVAYEADWILFLLRAARGNQDQTLARILDEVDAGPSPKVLKAAPVLRSWFVVRDPSAAICFTGAVSNHPLLPGVDRWIATSAIVGLDMEAGYGRTYSRWYRLGRLITVPEYEALRGKPLSPALRPMNITAVKPWLARLRARSARQGSDV